MSLPYLSIYDVPLKMPIRKKKTIAIEMCIELVSVLIRTYLESI